MLADVVDTALQFGPKAGQGMVDVDDAAEVMAIFENPPRAQR
ncbi:hypothetical protein [Streptomyces sp. NPDC004728]